MAWNEPGGNDNDPWGNRKNSGGGGNNNGGPPDLDEVFKNLKNKLDGLFGKKGGGNGSSFGSGGGMSGGQIGGLGLSIIALVALGFWGASGFYVVQPAEAGVETRFGKHTETTAPGWHWHIPWPVETVEKVDVAQVRTAKMNQQIALTQDENLVKITLSVQYNIQSAEQYLFNVKFPDQTLEQVVESAVREAIGQADMEAIITTEVVEAAEGDSEPVEVEDLQSITSTTVQAILDQYETGLIVTAVSLEEAQPPDEVQAAFSDAIKAREDKERIISEAEAYANEILPVARGDAARIIEEAEGYKTRVEQSALGESQRFLSLLKEYKKAPEVTRERLYIEAMESVLGNTSKVLVDQNEGGGNSLMYLPIDKLIGQSNSSGTASGAGRVGVLDSSANDAPRFSDLPLDQTDINRNNSRSRDRGVVR
jgi:membrane protease subunit HflK